MRSTTKKRIYLIIVLIYNLDGGIKWDINTYEYITNDKWCFFLHWKKHFQIISNGNFLYFYFCKGWDACRFFYITKGTLIFAFAWHLGSAWAWHSISVYIRFAKRKKTEMSARETPVIWQARHPYLTVVTKIPDDPPRCFLHSWKIQVKDKKKKKKKSALQRGTTTREKPSSSPTFYAEFSSQSETNTTVTSRSRS